MFQVAEMSFELIEELRPLVERIRSRDRSLAEQLRRAASSICLNLAEGNSSDPGNQRARFHTAAGSAEESRAALRLAVGWRLIAPEEAEKARAMLNSIVAILCKLARR